MAITLLQAGAQSATWLVTYDPTKVGQALFLGPTEWASLPNGKLKNLLNKQYLTVGGAEDTEAFMYAYAEAGASMVSAVPDAFGAAFKWLVSQGPTDPNAPTVPVGVPYAYAGIVPPFAEPPKVVRIQTAYSASE